MKEVYYKGQPYQYKVVDFAGKRQFQLYEDGILKHSVEQGDLDIRSIVSFILDSYYRNPPSKINNGVLH
ncbi:MAG: hypothetical protein WA874_02665 [Chryseosolibacter sp.]